MKKLIALLLALMMLFSVATVFAGCEDSGKKKKTSSRRDEDDDDDEDEDEEDENEDGEDTYETISAAVENAGAEKIDVPVPPSLNVDVQDAYFGIVDSELAGDYAPKCFHVPQILVNGEVLPNVSQQLMEDLLPKEEEYELQNMTYEWWHDGDILSIVVRFSWVFNDAISYQIYNISLSQDKILTDREFCATMGTSLENCQNTLTGFLQAFCDNLKPGEFYDQETVNWLISDTMSQENLERSAFFLGADGKVNFVTRVAVPAGAGWSVRLYTGDGAVYYLTVDNHQSCS